MRITVGTGPFELRVKRFRFPCLIRDDCPGCGVEKELDLSAVYLSYPVLNDRQSIDLYCGECQQEWELVVVLRLTVEVLPL